MSNQLEEYRSRLRESLGIINDLKAKVAAAERAKAEPLAIVGMSCRLPGGSNSPDAFWNNLMRGADAVGEVPSTRWLPSEIEGAGNDVRWAGLIDGIDQFDAAFFGISPREAASLDPQHRLLLELSWEAVEDAGIQAESLLGSKTGVYIGICTNDYWQGIVRRGTRAVDTYGATGNLLSTAAGRISFWLGLEGPCASVDTACSSSLVALHFACHGLQSGACDQALVGGVNAILSPFSMTMMSRLGALSQDGRCKTFDARANGYVRGEGCGVIVIKRLSDARRDGDRIRAVILGSAINQDGRSTGLTTPNVLSQQTLLRQALTVARVTTEDIGYIETHGTGTPLGDPIEIDALKAVFGRPRANRLPCILGALKTNIGHLEGAAGISGLIKTVLCLEREAIPKNLHQRVLNPRIDIDGTPFVIPRENMPWARGNKPRRAGISSFGISGTNAHVILEEAPPELPTSNTTDLSAYLLPLSAKTPDALLAITRTYADWLSGTNDIRLDDLAHTAGTRRTHHEHRLAIVGNTRAELVNTLRAVGRNESPAGATIGRTVAAANHRLIFVFSGQGSQWAGMGKLLLAEEPVFGAKLEEIATIVQRHASFSLLHELSAPEAASRLSETEIVQPAIFAIQVAIAELLKSWGIKPDAVIGHSVGEIAAAHVSGSLGLEDAVRLAVIRGRIMQKATGRGKMAWVAMSPDLATRLLVGHEKRCAIAAINDPDSVVLSGDPAALDVIIPELEQRGIVTRPLRVNYAFHSPQMDPFVDELVGALGHLDAKNGTIAMYSTVTAAVVHGSKLTPEYWGQNMRATVNFADAVRLTLTEGYDSFLEIGPHPVLLSNLQQCAARQNIAVNVLPSLRRNASERRALLEALGALYTRGYEVEWKGVCQQRGRVTSLPAYAWQKERFWLETQRSTNAVTGLDIHPLLGMRIDSSIAPGEHVWQQSVGADGVGYLNDHRVQDEVVFPGAGYVEMAITAASTIHGQGTVVIDEMSLHFILALAPGVERQLQTVLQKDEDGFSGIAISSRGERDDAWTRHSTIRVHVDASTPRSRESLQAIEERCSEMIDHAEHYTSMTNRELHYGKAFRGVRSVRVGANESLGRVSATDTSGSQLSNYGLHPTLLDACFQAASWALSTNDGNALIPKEFLDFRYYGRPVGDVWVHSRFLGHTEDGTLSIGITIFDDHGNVFVEIGEMRIAPWNGSQKRTADPVDQLLYRLVWRRKDLPASSSVNPRGEGSWLILSDDRGVGRAIASDLRSRRETCVEAIAATAYGRTESGDFRLDPAEPTHWQRLLSEAFSQANPCKGVIHALSLDATPWDRTTSGTLHADLRRSCLTALRLTQSLLKQGWRDVPRLYLLTRGVHALQPVEKSVGVSQAPLWGLGRTIALEYPALECTRIDLSDMPSSLEIEKIVRELLVNDIEDQVALRGADRYVLRLAHDTISLAASRAFAFRPNRTYLITGGLGGIGLELAQWMVNEGARHLILLSRSAPSDLAKKTIAQLEYSGAVVHAVSADVSQYDQLRTVIDRANTNDLPIAGIVHAAAILEDRLLLDMSEKELMAVMGAKVFGAFHLHTLTIDQPLDFFVVYSSVAGVLGSPGQANYAAANAFLDAWARARTDMGLVASSIAWGPFKDVGMAAARDDRGKRLSSRGIEGISPAEGNDIFGKLLCQPRAEAIAARLSIRQWQEVLPQAASLPMLAELRLESGTEVTRDNGRAFRQLLENTEATRRAALIRAHTLEQLGHVLRLDPTRIDTSATFASLGVDSLISLELRNRLQASLGLELQPTLLFTYPTLEKLVTHVIGKLGLSEQTVSSGTTVQAEPKPSTASSPADDMGVDDLLALLDEELSATKKRG